MTLRPFCRDCGEALTPHGLGEYHCPECGTRWDGALYDVEREARIDAEVDALLADD